MNYMDMCKLTVDAYRGTGGFLDGTYLHKYVLESDTEYGKRRGMAYYENQVGGMVRSSVEPVFADKISRNGGGVLYQSFVADCDRKKTPLSQWLREVAQWHVLLGNVYVVIDNVENPTANVQMAIESRSYPYLYYILPHEAEEVELSPAGEVVSITYSAGEKNIDGKNVSMRRTMTTDAVWDWYQRGSERVLYGKKRSVSGSRVIMTGSDIRPVPPYLSMATIAREIYNMGSEQREAFRTQAFSMLVVKTDEPIASAEVGAKTIMSVDKDGGDAKYISPDTSVLRELGDVTEKLVKRMNDQARNLGVRLVEKHYKSGTAISYDYAPSHAIMTNLSTLMERIEQSIAKLFSRLSGESQIAEITYSRDYSPAPDRMEAVYEKLTFAMEQGYSEEQKQAIRNTAYDMLMNMVAGADHDD